MTPTLRSVAGVGVLLLTVAGCSSSRPPKVTARSSAASRYLAIADPANRRLDHAFDALDDGDEDSLAASIADLHAVANTERRFDRQLLALSVPTAATVSVRDLVALNEYRADLTATAAQSTNMAALRAAKPGLTAANDPVEQQVRILRTQLGLPPPDTD